MRKHFLFRFFGVAMILGLVASSVTSAFAAQVDPALPNPPPPVEGEVAVPDPETPALLARPEERASDRYGGGEGGFKGDISTLAALGGEVINVHVRLEKASLARSNKLGAEAVAYAQEVAAYQDEVAREIEQAGGKVIYKFRTLSSGLIVEMPGRIAPEIARIPQVTHVSKINDYQVDLNETVPFIGADYYQDAGFDGTGVKVAVLDSGIDFTHLAFGGPGTVNDWQTAYWGTDPTCVTSLGRSAGCANALAPNPAYFGPTAPKVKGGYDWVGPAWPSGALAPDENPIANRSNSGTGDNGTHGTHVADIIGGLPYTGSNGGVAPGVDLYAFTVCSSIATSCAGVAMLQGLDDAADLDNDLGTKDPADVVNMSLGSFYGQPEDDTSALVNELVAYGSIVVASAGNSGDKPFVVGSPSSASGAISVAQTTLPSEMGYILNTSQLTDPDPIGILQPWSGAVPVGGVSGLLRYDTTNASTRIGCANTSGGNPWGAGALAGMIALVDRGSCSVSYKAANAQAAGAIATIVVNNQPQGQYDLPPSFAYGGGTVTTPAFTIIQADGDRLKAVLGAISVTVSIANTGSSLSYSVVSSSSRGPRNHDNVLKPDIGAPGASTSAVAGTGSGMEAFGGTSGAAPMVAGAVALLKDSFGDAQNFTNPVLLPQQYKTLLMNNANRVIYKNGSDTGYLVGPSRVGSGQVDLANAFVADFIAWDSTSADPVDWTGSLSFQYQPVSDVYTATRQVTLLNMSASAATFEFSSEFRDPVGDGGKGVEITFNPTSLNVPGNSTATVDVTLTIDLSQATTLPTWPTNISRGASGFNGFLMDAIEIDGWVSVLKRVGEIGTTSISLPWHVLPKAVGDLTVTNNALASMVEIENASPLVSTYSEMFALVDIDPNDYNYQVGDCSTIGLLPGCNETRVDIKEVGVRRISTVLQFAITLYDAPYRAGQFPVEFDIYLDVDNDGTEDYVIYNYDLASGSDGRNGVFYKDLDTSAVGLTYYTLSDFNSNNFILTVPVGASGIVIPDETAPLNFYVLAYDAYFTGGLTDASPDNRYYHTISPSALRFAPVDPDDWFVTVIPGGTYDIPYTQTSGTDVLKSPSQIGFLLLHDKAHIGEESTAVQLGIPTFEMIFLPLLNR